MQYPHSFYYYFWFKIREFQTKKSLMNGIAYAQCREEVDGSWGPDSSWQCQQPGDSATDSSIATTPSTNNSSSGNSDGSLISNISGTSSSGSDPSSDSTSSQAATTGDCTSTSVSSDWDGVAFTSVSLSGSQL